MACDLVVQLDEHLCLTQDAPQLAAMFFRRPATWMQNEEFFFVIGSLGFWVGSLLPTRKYHIIYDICLPIYLYIGKC